MKEQSKIILSIEEMDEEHFKQDNPATDQEQWDAGASLYGYNRWFDGKETEDQIRSDFYGADYMRGLALYEINKGKRERAQIRRQTARDFAKQYLLHYTEGRDLLAVADLSYALKEIMDERLQRDRIDELNKAKQESSKE